MICFPLDNTEYTAEALGAWCGVRSRGVFSGEGHFEVSCAGGMGLSVTPGIAWLKKSDWWGVAVCERGVTALAVEPCHASLHRIDAVCLRLDKNANVAELVMKKGKEAASPALEPPARNNSYDEIYLAKVNVPAGVLAITAAYVTDLRLDESYCGLMRDGVSQVPTQALQSQAAALLARIEEQTARLEENSEVMLKSKFSPEASAAVSGSKLVITSQYAHTGSSYAVEFDAPEAYTASRSLRIDGTDMEGVYSPDGIVVPSGAWASGAPVQLSRRGSRAFFKQGGAALGLKILSGPTMPGNPEENLIWVKSYLDVNAATQKVYYGYNVPEAGVVANGDLFVICGRGNLEVHSPDGRTGLCPVGVLQKQAGTWVPAPALMWKNGKWNLFYPTDNLFNQTPFAGSYINAIDGKSAITGPSCNFTTDPVVGSVLTMTATATSHINFEGAEYVSYMRPKTLILAVKPTLSDANARTIISAGSSTNGFRLEYVNGVMRMNYWTSPTIDGTVTLATDQWHVIAASQHPVENVARLFVNGEADGVITGASKYASLSRITIGNSYGGYAVTAAYKGSLSQLFWYGTCLEPEEVCCLSKSLLAKVQGYYN